MYLSVDNFSSVFSYLAEKEKKGDLINTNDHVPPHTVDVHTHAHTMDTMIHVFFQGFISY